MARLVYIRIFLLFAFLRAISVYGSGSPSLVIPDESKSFSNCSLVLLLTLHETRISWPWLYKPVELTESIGYIGARAAQGDSGSLKILKSLSQGEGRLALSARSILEHWEQLRRLGAFQSRSQFIDVAVGITENHMAMLTRMLLRQASSSEISGEARRFYEGTWAVIVQFKSELTPHRDVPESERDEFMEKVHRLGNHGRYLSWLSTKLQALPDTSLSDSAKYLSSVETDPRSLATIIRKSLVRNLLFASTEGVEFRFLISSGVMLKFGPGYYQLPEIIEGLVFDLVQNSIKYSSPVRDKTWVEITLANNKLLVSDNGIGIETQERVFAEGFREERNSARGQGLGLAVWQKILKNHGFPPLVLESTSPQGSIFSLDLSSILAAN